MVGAFQEEIEIYKSRMGIHENDERQHSDMELMKERFAKLLLGEDMSGGGNGVFSALALSNAITNLADSVFGEQKKLQPMSSENKAKWRKEIDWLLSVTDYVVEFVPSKQTSKDGTHMEIMVTRQRSDLHTNIPILRKLDVVLLEILDNFKDQNEFYYTTKENEKGKTTKRKDDKFWISSPKVLPEGLSDITRKWLQYQKDSVNQVLKAAMAINGQVLSEMEIPESYIESLPKNGRASLGDTIYKSITDENFDTDDFLCSLDLSSERKIVDIKNRIEATIVIWKRKMNAKDSKSSWSSAVSLEKREVFEDRAETVLVILKHRFPGIPQSAMDTSKIQYNRDVGQASLESYSRIIQSLALTMLSRIDDVIRADSLAKDPLSEEKLLFPLYQKYPSFVKGLNKFSNSKEEPEKLDLAETPTSMTLLDFIVGEKSIKKDLLREISLGKLSNIVANKKVSYIETLEKIGGTRSPTARNVYI